MSQTRTGDARNRLLPLFNVALAAVRGDRLAEAALSGHTVDHVIAIGKAAEALAAGASRAAGAGLKSGFVALPRGYETHDLQPGSPIERHLGGHPVPDMGSVASGGALVDYIRRLPAGDAVTVLLSGGGSACIELPVKGANLATLRRVNAWLLGSGFPIQAVNAVRSRFSQIKGGGLRGWLRGRDVQAWVLTDVLGDGERWVAGAPLGPSPELPAGLPGWLRRQIDSLPPKWDAEGIELHRLAGNRQVVEAACRGGAEDAGTLACDMDEALSRLLAFIGQAAPGIYAWGGEITLRLPPRTGRGGRCRHLALALAQALEGHEDWTLLAAGTDGWDGTDGVAGACVDGMTSGRGRARGLDAGEALRTADSGGFFAGSVEQIVTGPTGTNVNDLILLWKR